MARGRVHLPGDQHGIIGQHGKVNRLVDGMGQIAHQRPGGGGQAADQRGAMGDFKQQRGQHITVGVGIQRDIATVLQHHQHAEHLGHGTTQIAGEFGL